MAPLAAGLSARNNRPSQPPGRDCIFLPLPSGAVLLSGRTGNAGPDRACGGFRISDPKDVPDHENHIPRPVQAAAGAIRTGLKSRECEVPPVGCGHHPAIFGPRACCATHLYLFRKAKPACGPPDFHFPNSGVFARGAIRLAAIPPQGWRPGSGQHAIIACGAPGPRRGQRVTTVSQGVQTSAVHNP